MVGPGDGRGLSPPSSTPAQAEYSDTTHPAHTSLLAQMWGFPTQTGCLCPAPAQPVPEEPRSRWKRSKLVGGRGALEPLVAGERPTPVPRVLLPQPPAPSLEALPLLEQGGHVQQRVLDVLPQPVGVLEGGTGGVQGEPGAGPLQGGWGLRAGGLGTESWAGGQVGAGSRDWGSGAEGGGVQTPGS